MWDVGIVWCVMSVRTRECVFYNVCMFVFRIEKCTNVHCIMYIYIQIQVIVLPGGVHLLGCRYCNNQVVDWPRFWICHYCQFIANKCHHISSRCLHNNFPDNPNYNRISARHVCIWFILNVHTCSTMSHRLCVFMGGHFSKIHFMI